MLANARGFYAERGAVLEDGQKTALGLVLLIDDGDYGFSCHDKVETVRRLALSNDDSLQRNPRKSDRERNR